MSRGKKGLAEQIIPKLREVEVSRGVLLADTDLQIARGGQLPIRHELISKVLFLPPAFFTPIEPVDTDLARGHRLAHHLTLRPTSFTRHRYPRCSRHEWHAPHRRR